MGADELVVQSDQLRLLGEGAVAVGIGLFIGLEREHRHVDEGEPAATILGVRTFALLSLTGWVSALLLPTWAFAPAVLLALIGMLVLAQYVKSASEHGFGITTEVAALLTVTYGALVHYRMHLAVALGLVTTLILISKPWWRMVVPQLLRVELTAVLQLLIVAAIVLPLLPVEPLDPWGVLPPRSLGLFVLLVAGIGFVGYVLTRLLGASRAAGLTGLVGGLASSTAVTASMAQQARRAPALLKTSEVTVFTANAVMCVRVLVVTAVVSRPVALSLAAPLGAMAAVMLAGTLLASRGSRSKARGEVGELAVRNPFALLPALKWGLFLCVVLLVAHFAQQLAGSLGLLVAAVLAGLTDVDAITLASSRQVAQGTLEQGTAQLAITLAVMSNTVVKAVLARLSGGPAFGADVAKVFAAAVAVAVLMALLL